MLRKRIVLVRARLPGRAAEHGDPRSVDPAHERQQRREHGRDDAGQDAEHADGGKADDRQLRVAGVDLPQLAEAAEVDEPDHGGDDDRGERRLRETVEEGREKEHRRDDEGCDSEPRDA